MLDIQHISPHQFLAQVNHQMWNAKRDLYCHACNVVLVIKACIFYNV